jgi:hypothetical protein
VTQLYPRALGSLFVATYDSQGYGGGILTRLHTGDLTISQFREMCGVVAVTLTLVSESYESWKWVETKRSHYQTGSCVRMTPIITISPRNYHMNRVSQCSPHSWKQLHTSFL